MATSTFTPFDRTSAAGTVALITALEQRLTTLENPDTTTTVPEVPELVLSREQLTFLSTLQDDFGDSISTLHELKMRVSNGVGAYDFITHIVDNELYEGQNCPTLAEKVAGDDTIEFVDDFDYIVWDDYTDLVNRAPQIIPPGKYFYHIAIDSSAWLKIRALKFTFSCKKVSDDSVTFESGGINWVLQPTNTSTMENLSGFSYPITFYHEVFEEEYLSIHVNSILTPLGAWDASMNVYVRITRMCPLA